METVKLPKVSVITCSHNRADMLRRAVESLRAQTDQDWEHLIYDDASTDATVASVLEWAARDPRVRVWRGKKNLDQPSVLWNFMMDRAYGRYLTVLDDDNEKLPTFVEAMSRVLDAEPDVGVVTCGWQVHMPARVENYFLNLSTSADRLENLSTCDGGAMLYRREIFERAGYFSEALRTNEDWDWLRRAVHVGKIKNLHEVHATYRSHDGSRMRRSSALGNDADVLRVRGRRLSTSLSVRALFPAESRLTASQLDVCASVDRALSSIDWIQRVSVGQDLAIVVSPFQMDGSELDAFLAGSSRVLSWHMEDPYALSANLDRIQRVQSAGREVWVCTNDASTVPAYREVVGDRVFACSSLSADPSMAAPVSERDIDVLLCGYAYPSRRRFVEALLPLLAGLRVRLVGDGWAPLAREGVSTLPTQGLSSTYRLHARARAVVCLQRVHGDCSDGSVEPITLNRGFMEGFSGARVFLDSTRSRHSLDAADVVWYRSEQDLANKLRAYLASTPDAAAAAAKFAEKCGLSFTYRARLARAINCVRSPRFLAEIP